MFKKNININKNENIHYIQFKLNYLIVFIVLFFYSSSFSAIVGRLIPCLMKKSSVLILNSLKLSTPMTEAIDPTNTPTPEQLAAVPSKSALPAKARSEAK